MMQLDRRYFKRRLAGYVLETQSVLRGIGETPTVPEHRFVLFGRGRSGSTLLVQMLDANPAIGCLDEVLRFRTLRPVAMVDRELGRLQKPIRGFKLLSYQVRTLHNQKQGAALYDWMTEPSVKVFHLQRDNILRHALSNIYAETRATYHSTDKRAGQTDKITISPEQLFSWMRGSLDLLEWEKQYLGKMEREVIVYERDLATPERQRATLERVSRALGVPPVASEAPLRKVTPREYGAFIENWADLRTAIAGSEFAPYLDRTD